MNREIFSINLIYLIQFLIINKGGTKIYIIHLTRKAYSYTSLAIVGVGRITVKRQTPCKNMFFLEFKLTCACWIGRFKRRSTHPVEQMQNLVTRSRQVRAKHQHLPVYLPVSLCFSSSHSECYMPSPYEAKTSLPSEASFQFTWFSHFRIVAILKYINFFLWVHPIC